LIEAGCPVNAPNKLNKLPLMSAVESKADNEIIRLLLDAGSNTNLREDRRKQTALFTAVATENREAVRMLLDAGCDVNIPDIYGNTPLLTACSLADETMVDWLLQCPDIRVNVGIAQLPLHAAAVTGSTAVVGRLLERGADVNGLTLTGQSALFQAANYNHLDVARLLVRHGACPLAVGSLRRRGDFCCRAHRDPHPHTELHPLFAAVQNDNLDMIRLLVAASPRTPYSQLYTMRDVLFRTKYADEAALAASLRTEFERLFDSELLAKPRPLACECRGAVRRAVCFGRVVTACRGQPSAADAFWRAIESLPLPESLKDFVRLRNEPLLNVVEVC